jgi:hypothetical protein
MKTSFQGLKRTGGIVGKAARARKHQSGEKHLSVAEIRTLAAKYAAFQQRQGLG